MLLVAVALSSCVSLRERPHSEDVPLPLQEVYERRDDLSGRRITIEAFIFSDREGASLGRADDRRSRVNDERKSCARASAADLLVPWGRIPEFRRINQHRVIVSGVLRTERSDLHLGTIIIEYLGRLDEARLEYVYSERCSR